MRTLQLLVAAFALVQLLRYGRAAVQFLLPRVRVWGDATGAPGSPARLRAADALAELGFVGLGVRRERSLGGAVDRTIDCYASPTRATFADVFEDRAHAARVAFFTRFADGAAVLTADHARPSISTRMAQAGALPDAAPGAVLAAHEVAVKRFAAAHGGPIGGDGLEARLVAARAWYRGEGRRELRHGKAPAVVVAGIALLLLASAVGNLMRGGR